MDGITIGVATWNIGGGIVGASHQRDESPSIDYHASVIKKFSPDIVCLQEAHVYADGRQGQPESLASKCGYAYAASYPVSESHLIPDAKLALGILSRFPTENLEYRQFPNPGLTGASPAGDAWQMLDKGYFRSSIDLGSTVLGLINVHCFPFHYFGASATEPRFANIWDVLIRDMASLRRDGPALVAIDLNYEPAQDLLAAELGRGKYDIAFENTPTTPRGVQQDYVFYAPGMRLVTTSVTPTESDHSYCQVTIAL
jgi:endonuclease/exonuclease/phosphatase family metal-dependent hydrolase